MGTPQSCKLAQPAAAHSRLVEWRANRLAGSMSKANFTGSRVVVLFADGHLPSLAVEEAGHRPALAALHRVAKEGSSACLALRHLPGGAAGASADVGAGATAMKHADARPMALE